MSRLRILITHPSLDDQSGSVLYVRDLALGLLRSGHLPVLFTTARGTIGAQLHNATVPVVDDLSKVADTPDIIIGNGHPELMTALMRFRQTPAIHVCHAWDHWITLPPELERVRRVAAVDITCRDWLACEQGVAPERIRIIQNAVDVDRFRPRSALPPKPRHALVFSSYFTEANGLIAIRNACSTLGMSLDVVGAGVGNLHTRPEDILGNYDIVFAKARCALEAMAVGTAVVLANPGVAGPLVDPDNLGFLWERNFGRRALDRPLTEDYLLQQISRYDPSRSALVSERVRAEGNLDHFVDKMVALCNEVIAEHADTKTPDLHEELAAIAAYVGRAAPLLSHYYKVLVALHFSEQDRSILAADNNRLRASIAQFEDHSKQLARALEQRAGSVPVAGRIRRLLQRAGIRLNSLASRRQ